jgi:hypothetical protein
MFENLSPRRNRYRYRGIEKRIEQHPRLQKGVEAGLAAVKITA